MPYLSESGLLKFQGSETYVFAPYNLKVQNSFNNLEVLKYGISRLQLILMSVEERKES
jgi:hypothetical protein